jgi:hypothetical protein
MVDRGAQVLARTTQPSLALLRDDQARAWASVPGVRRLERADLLRDEFMHDEKLPALMVGAEQTFEPEPHAVTHWQRPRPDLAEVDLSLEHENFLVMLEQCARGWSATVDGAEVTPVRVDGGVCAVKVGAGTHHVRLHYVPPGWPWAWGVLGLGLLACAVIIGRTERHQRRD